MNKDVLIAGGIVLFCVLLIALTFTIPKKHKVVHDKQLDEKLCEIKYLEPSKSDDEIVIDIIDNEHNVIGKIIFNKHKIKLKNGDISFEDISFEQEKKIND
jgi:hypothetical protein